MKCPVDESDLTMSERQGIEIDYCPKCRGVWLDRGELDKLIERSENQSSSHYEKNRNQRDNRNDDGDEDGGFLSSIFGGFGRDD